MRRTVAAAALVSVFLSGIFSHAYSADEATAYAAAIRCLGKKGEVYFKFSLNSSAVGNRSLIEKLTRCVSIDNIRNDYVYAYANANEFASFLKFGFSYEVLLHPGDMLQNPKMAKTAARLVTAWDAYPTYPAYVAMMDTFAQKYPDKCKIIQIGTSTAGRKLLYAKITANVNQAAKKPRFMYSSSMHGDETTMYVTMLRLIDYLLSNYATNTYVKKLVDSIETWICPLENPDGTYRSGDNTVNGAVRYTNNNVDLNRHYPNFSAGRHPDGRSTYEPECQAVLNFLDTCQFVMSANFHGGAELLNYAYDARAALHQDDAWMKYVYGKYRDTVHAINSTYMTGQNNGITNGYAWYQIFGSRMDYITWSKFGREVTIEASTVKLVPPSELPNYWNWNYKSLLQLMEQSLFGINGTVVDSVTRTPLKAKVFVQSHDGDSSFTVSKLPFGDYYRPIIAGTWSVEYSCPGCASKTVSNITVQNNRATVVNVELRCATGTTAFQKDNKPNTTITVIPLDRGVKISFNAVSAGAAIYNIHGGLVKQFQQRDFTEIVWDESEGKITNGYYIIKSLQGNRILTKGFIVAR
jgi:hypothetical protein